MKAYVAYWEEGVGALLDTRFGNDPETSLRDAGAMGVSVLRHLGGRDLYWNQLAPDLTADNATAWRMGQPIPVLEPEDGVELEALIQSGFTLEVTDSDGNTAVLSHDNVENMLELMGVAQEEGMKLILTLLHHGGWGKNTDAVPEELVVDTEYQQGNSALAHSPGTLVQSWSEEHEEASVDQKFGAEGDQIWYHPVQDPDQVVANVRIPEMVWHAATLDVCSLYKRAYLARIAYHVGQMLNKVHQELEKNSGCSLYDVVEMIEIFNEIDDASIFKDEASQYDPYHSAIAWGRTWFDLAYALREGLGSELDAIRIGLPAVHSYYEEAGASDYQTWESRRAFVQYLVQHAVTEAVQMYSSASEAAAALPRYLQGIDLHWYHCNAAADESDPIRHIGYLVHEVEALREAVRAGVEKAISPDDYTEELTALLNAFPISVMENGGLGADTGNAANPFVADDATEEEAADALEQFQAWDVWRRVGGALASEASTVGWHAWMASDTGALAGTGLRVTPDTAGGDPAEAVPRRSYLAFRRLTQLLSKVSTGRMLLPDTESRDDLAARIANFPDDGDVSLVVFEYEGEFQVDDTPTCSYAYLVFREPSMSEALSEHPAGSDCLLVTRHDIYRAAPDVYQVPIEPPAVELEEDAGELAGLPRAADVDWDSVIPWEMGAEMLVCIKSASFPILFFSKTRLYWALSGMVKAVNQGSLGNLGNSGRVRYRIPSSNVTNSEKLQSRSPYNRELEKVGHERKPDAPEIPTPLIKPDILPHG